MVLLLPLLYGFDAHEKTLEECRTKSAACDPMELNETKQSSQSEAEKGSASDIMHRRLLEQMECLCRTVQNMEDRMEGKISHAGLRRQEDNQKLKEMCVRMDEGFKNEESVRKLVQNDLAAMKEEVRQVKLGSGSTVCGEASTAVCTGASGTFAKPPPGTAARYHETFVPRKMEFTGWITDFTRSSFQGTKKDEVAAFVVDLIQIIPRSKVCGLGTDKNRTRELVDMGQLVVQK